MDLSLTFTYNWFKSFPIHCYYYQDLKGNTVEVSLEAGDMLLYESAKCYHGRPRRFEGQWYTSIFLHYAPVDWDESDQVLETHYRIHDKWDKSIVRDPKVERLECIDTGIKEPECEHQWCSLKSTIKFKGPGPGVGVVAAGGKTFELKGLMSEEGMAKEGAKYAKEMRDLELYYEEHQKRTCYHGRTIIVGWEAI